MSSGAKFKMNDGDWICSDSQCSNVNFARRTTCNRCGKDNISGVAKLNSVESHLGTSTCLEEPQAEKEKTAIPQRKKLGHEIGKAAAEKSRGLFSADDWQCGRCGNVNWARRQQCNMCNAPKFGEVEERTGLGGGYNERENVEYIEREESDGEYDEFGRKKKKYRGSDDKPNKMKTPSVKEEKVKESHKYKDEEEEEEEEDDDDEDGDLSKYDLTGWGDDDDENEVSKKDKKSPSRSRSSVSSRSDSSHSRSRSSSSSSSSSKSSHSSSDSAKPKSKNKRHYSRSRSASPVNRKRSKRDSSGSSRSSSSSSRSRSRDRSASYSPANRKT